MNAEGEACCYVLFENVSPARAAVLLRGELTGLQRSFAEAIDPSTRSSSVGSTSDGWAVIIDPQFDLGDSDAELVECSVGTRVVRLLVIDNAGFSHTKAWVNGEFAWEVSYEAELDDRPAMGGGQFPYDVDELARAVGDGDPRRTWCQVPILAAQRLTGWRGGSESADANLRLTELIWPQRQYGREASRIN